MRESYLSSQGVSYRDYDFEHMKRLPVITYHDGYSTVQDTAFDALKKGPFPVHRHIHDIELSHYQSDPVNYLRPKAGDIIEYRDDGSTVLVPRSA